MNILISTFGTHGDVQPFIALGHGLRAAGHEVTLCTSASYQPAILHAGLHYAYMSDALLDVTRALLSGSGRPRALLRRLQAAMRASLQDEWAAAQRVKPDVIVHHPKMLGSYHIAETLGVPLFEAIPLPFYTPTRAFPNPFFANLRLGGWANRASFRLMALSSALYSGMTNHFRVQTLGLPPLRRFADLLVRQDGTPIPLLYPYSPHLLPVPDDFPAHVTGFWFGEPTTAWSPPPALVRFLESGPPPIYVGFGSMGGKGAERRVTVVRNAVAQAGQRAILARGWGGLAARDLPDTMCMVDAVPHDWLFPQLAAVVHHGGAGTTAAGLRAGKPTVICPFLGDQPFWGRVVFERGLGPRPIPQRQLTAPRLAAAIHAAVANGETRTRAAALGVQIRAEDGVGQAVRIVNRQVGAPAVAAPEPT